VQVIFPNVGNMPVQLLDLLDLLTPVTRKLHLLCKGTLQSCEFLLGLHESVDRLYVVYRQTGQPSSLLRDRSILHSRKDVLGLLL